MVVKTLSISRNFAQRYGALLTILGFAWFGYSAIAQETAVADGALKSSTVQEIPPLERLQGEIPDKEFADIKKRISGLTNTRRDLDAKVWNPEVLAQAYEKSIFNLLDALRSSGDRFTTLAKFKLSDIVLSRFKDRKELDNDIVKLTFKGEGKAHNQDEWVAFLQKLGQQGYEIEQTELHQTFFKPATDTEGAFSELNAVFHARNTKDDYRAIVRAEIGVQWEEEVVKGRVSDAKTVWVYSMQIFERKKPVAFKEIFTVSGTAEQPIILPLLVYDLDKDGKSEIIVVGQNLLLKNNGEGQFEGKTFLPKQRSLYDAAVLADFTGDGEVDLVGVDNAGFPLLFEGNGDTTFKDGVVVNDTHFDLPKTFTAGDVDKDGDLDLFIANYKYAYRQGQMPSPYFDANDGYPAALLLNDGSGHFTDNTEAAGLSAKRYRRSYSSSFVDLDDDQDLDLIVVSDYAGFDVYENNGSGEFTDITNTFGLDRHFFGMGHTFADYDNNGKLDFYVIGMSSTTSRRLDNMGLIREDKPQHTAMRTAMGYGNRMFLGGHRRLSLSPNNATVARTGWSWGASSFDFDNDGDKDIFVANGHYTGKSSQDYCTVFWRHDIYDEGEADPAKNFMFQLETEDLRKADISWNGYEHKVMLMNTGDAEFINIAYLLGVSFEYDGRAVVSEDLDGDGRQDLLVVQFKTNGLDDNRYTLHVYQNQLETVGNWIGITLPDTVGRSPIGAKVYLQADGKQQYSQYITGDSFSSQHSARAHFGIGALDKVDKISVEWFNGTRSVIEAPAINQYHAITPLNIETKQHAKTP